MSTQLRTQEANVPLGLKYHHVDVFSSKPLSGNGVTVFRLREALPTAVMQELTREMRQFESIFVLREARSQTVRAWVFTMEEELDFAGHPVLGAAAALHEETMAGIREVSWTFQLNKKSTILPRAGVCQGIWWSRRVRGHSQRSSTCIGDREIRVSFCPRQ